MLVFNVLLYLYKIVRLVFTSNKVDANYKIVGWAIKKAAYWV